MRTIEVLSDEGRAKLHDVVANGMEGGAPWVCFYDPPTGTFVTMTLLKDEVIRWSMEGPLSPAQAHALEQLLLRETGLAGPPDQTAH